MKRIVFINRFCWPDLSATSQVLIGLACGLADDYDVTVVAARKLYNDPQARLERRERHRGVEILRLNTTRLGRDRLWRRFIDYASFYLRVFAYLLRHTRKGDIVVLMTDPPLLSLVNTAVVRLKGGAVINWLQDIFPEVAVELAVAPGIPVLTRALAWWRDRTLHRARNNVVISERMQAVLTGQGVRNTAVICNWADGELIRPLAHHDNALRAAWNPENRFLVGYSGNFGRAHSFDELLEAMTLLETRPEIHFLLIGEGAALERVQKTVASRRLSNVSFFPYQPNELLRQSLGAIDLHLVTLKPGMEGLLSPSKIYGVMAAGRPLAFVGEKAGEIAGLVESGGLGFVVGHGEGAELAEKIQQLAVDAGPLRSMGERARSLFDREFALPRAVDRWRTILSHAGDER